MRLKLWSPLSPVVAGVAALVFAVDQLHKWWMLNVYDIIEKSAVRITSFFDLVMVWNKGVSYGLFATHTQGWLIAVSLVITAVLWGWAAGAARVLTAAAIGLVIGGALANAFDRAVRGAVADFFHFHYHGLSWYVFNLADVAIVVGIGLLLYESLFMSEAPNRRGKA
jgi:signal peptidase II